MQWRDVAGGGFTEAERPWLPLGDLSVANVASQREDPNSVLAFCRHIIAFRRSHPEFSTGDTTSLVTPEDIWGWTRGDRHVVVLNLSAAGHVVGGLHGTIRVGTDRSREGRGVEGGVDLAPFEGVILERA